MLTDLITKYREAQRIWEAQWDLDCDSASDTPEWHTYMKLSTDILNYRCKTAEEQDQRIRFILSDAQIVDTLASSASERPVRNFLSSLLADPVDIGEDRPNGQP